MCVFVRACACVDMLKRYVVPQRDEEIDLVILRLEEEAEATKAKLKKEADDKALRAIEQVSLSFFLSFSRSLFLSLSFSLFMHEQAARKLKNEDRPLQASFGDTHIGNIVSV